jgi:hypothetical protein
VTLDKKSHLQVPMTSYVTLPSGAKVKLSVCLHDRQTAHRKALKWMLQLQSLVSIRIASLITSQEAIGGAVR